MKKLERYNVSIKIFDNESLTYVKLNDLTKILFALLILTPILFILMMTLKESLDQSAKIRELSAENNKLKELNEELAYERDVNNLHALTGKFVINKQTEEPTIDSLISFLNECGAWYPDIIVAQAILESATFTSNIYNNTYNMFGMRKPHSRETTSLNTYENNYANYYNWQLSAIDRIHWDLNIFRNKKPTRDEYINKIGAIYAEEPTYLQRIDSIIKKNNL